MYRCRNIRSFAIAAGLAAMALTFTSEAHAQSCLTSLQCPDTKPICNLLTLQCGDCVLNTQCLLRDLSEPACVNGDCVGCASNADCGGNTPICDDLLHICKPGICVGLSLLEHGIVDVSVAVTGVVRTYACISGYTLVGTSQTTCQANGLWSGTPPECVPTVGYCEDDLGCDAGQWCDIGNHSCKAKVGNGGAMPTDAGHTSVTIDGTCNPQAASIVCQSGVCDSDNKCGYANDHGVCTPLTPAVCRSGACGLDLTCGLPNGAGPCDASSAATICRSGTCSANVNVCIPAGGCAGDSDCGTSQWCNSLTFACESKVPNGSPIPSIPGHLPDISLGLCLEITGEAICASTVCSTTDNKCGYLNGEGPCTAQNEGTVCRSGHCDIGSGLCDAAPTCAIDSDCGSGSYCSVSEGACTAKLPNGAPIPNDPGHTPVLDGTCTEAAATAACQSGRCGADGKCGFDTGEGPCTALDAGSVCRSSSCSPTAATCAPAGGCILDGDCASTEWCSTLTFTCVGKLPNGAPIPTIPGHVPAVLGVCILGVGDALCQSGVCDSSDNTCGYAPGSGPCTEANAASICRSGVCDNGVCGESRQCLEQSDCDVGVSFCDLTAGVCLPKLPNGAPLPSILGIDLCNDLVGALVCASGVCDTIDNTCGYKTGRGPCTDLTAHLCRSGICAEDVGLCVECEEDGQCAGATGSCRLRDYTCVQCSIYSDVACAGATPVCDYDSSTCGACNGDLGEVQTRACLNPATPYCVRGGEQAGSCGRCQHDDDCAGHSNGARCDAATGACVPAITIDTPVPPVDGGPTPPTDGGDGQQPPAGDGLNGFMAVGAGCASVKADGSLAVLVLIGLLAARRARRQR